MTTKYIVVCTVNASGIVVSYEHGICSVNDHRVVDFACQLPAIAAFGLFFRLDDLVIMSRFEDLIPFVGRPDLTI